MLKSLIKYIRISISWEVKYMTRPKINNVCDFCGKEIASGNEYSVQFYQKGTGKGLFVKSEKPFADMCHACLLEVGKNGYKFQWETLKKNDSTGKWERMEDERIFNE